MNDRVLRLYHRMPGPVRSLIASARGFQLRSVRYGPETDSLVEEALEREQWSELQWKSWQENRIGFLLHRAATSVPYYRELWAERRRRGDKASWERLENWPVLEKDAVRRNPRAFLADDCDPRRMLTDSTSGTSGKPLRIWLSRETTRAWYALFEARCRSWYGLSRRDRWAILGGQLVAPVEQTKPPLWVWNHGLNQLYMSVYHLSPELAPSYLDALRVHGIQYLVGYPSAIEALADAALKLGGANVGLRVALANAEPLYPTQRQKIEAAFGCPVRETYGMSEIAAAASECTHGTLHLWPEAGFLETVENGAAVGAGVAGELISTALMNADMPLIRYRVGDRCILGGERDLCACGRTLPVLRSVEGRNDDVLFTKDGRRVGRLDPVFKSRLPIQEAQIVQETLHTIRVCYVPDTGFTQQSANELTRLIRERMGDVQVTLDPVERVPRSANGKFRAVVCKLSPEERAYLQSQPTSHAVR